MIANPLEVVSLEEADPPVVFFRGLNLRDVGDLLTRELESNLAALGAGHLPPSREPVAARMTIRAKRKLYWGDIAPWWHRKVVPASGTARMVTLAALMSILASC